MRKALIVFLLVISSFSMAQTDDFGMQDAVAKTTEAIASIMTVQGRIKDWQVQEFATLRQQIAELAARVDTIQAQIATAQIIWNLGVTCEATSCTLTWYTGAQTQANVSWGTTTSPTQALMSWTNDFTVKRTIVIQNLAPNTTYYFWAKARDGAGFQYASAGVAGKTGVQ